MKKQLLSITIVFILLTNCSYAQNIFPSTGSTGIGTSTPNASAILEIKSSTKGMLVPRMTKASRDAIAAPATGLLIYQTNSTPGFYYYSGTSWTAVSNAGANTSLSNLTTPTAINAAVLPDSSNFRNMGNATHTWKNFYFDGTVYSQGHKFISNDGPNLTCVFMGDMAGNVNSTYGNAGFGAQALLNNTTGFGNSGLGSQPLYSNTTGSENTALGYLTLFLNTTGGQNVASGAYALEYNTIGSYNSAFGVNALLNNSTGNYNTANGHQALYSNTEGTNNVAAGYNALYSNIGGYQNTANGVSALYSNTSGYQNTANGVNALYFNTTGIDNVANGYATLYSNTTGYYNTANGVGALHPNTTGVGNTAIGYGTLINNTTGNYNTAVGLSSDVNYTDVTNGSAFGSSALITASNQVRIGNSSVTSIGGYVNWSNISDGRAKKNIKQNVPGLAFINKLQPVTYNLDLNAADKIIQRPELKDKDGRTMQPSAREMEARKQKEEVVYTGFVAQDVEKTAKSLNYDFSGVDAAKNSKDLYGLRYSDFVVPLVKAVQELSKQNDDLQKQIDDLKAMVLSGNQSNTAGDANLQKQHINITGAFLEQNTPNPFNTTTTIHYTLPQSRNIGSSAQIIITDKSGKVLKQVNITGAGKGSVNIDAAMLSAGAYSYSLYVDGKLAGSKQMVLTK